MKCHRKKYLEISTIDPNSCSLFENGIHWTEAHLRTSQCPFKLCPVVQFAPFRISWLGWVFCIWYLYLYLYLYLYYLFWSCSRSSRPRWIVPHLYDICIYLWLSVLIIFNFKFLWLEILHGIKCIMLLKCWLVPNFTRHCTVFKLKLKNSTKLCGNLFLCFKEKPRFWSFFARVPVRCLLQKHQCTFGSTLNGTKFHMRLQLIAPIRYY